MSRARVKSIIAKGVARCGEVRSRSHWQRQNSGMARVVGVIRRGREVRDGHQ